MPNTIEKQFTQFQPYPIKEGEEYMNDAQKDHFRAILQNWKHQLMEEVDSTITHLKEEASNFADPSDRPARRRSSASNCAPVIANAS